MTDINRVILVGRLTRDAELKYTASNQAVCKFSIASNRSRKNGDQWVEEVSYFDIVVWGSQGQSIEKYLQKGKMVCVDGELRQDRWQQDGQNRSKIEVVAAKVQLLGGKPDGASSPSGGESDSYSNSNSYNSGSSSNRQADFGPSGDDNFADDIPF